MHQQKPMTEGKIGKTLAVFALPIFLGNLFQQLYNTADSLIVGNFLGSGPLAAVSSSSALIFMLIGFLSGIALGAGVVIARYFGAQETKKMKAAIHTTVAFGLLAGAAMTAIGVLLTPQILQWMDTPQNVMADSITYLRLYFAGSLGFVMYNIFVGILQAVGDSKHPLYYLMISSVINVVLDLFFIGVLHTGVGGAALATVIAQLVSAFLCLVQLVRTKDTFRIELNKIALDKEMFRQIIQIGLPSGVQNSIIAFANVVIQANINVFGPMAMAGVGAYSKVEGFAFLPINSLTMALTTFVGQNLGAGETQRARRGGALGIGAAVLLAQSVGIVVFLFAPHLIRAFDQNPQVVAFGTEKARSAALFYCLLAYSHGASAVLRGSGRSVAPMVILMALWCVFRVAALAILIPLFHSIQVVYWIYPVTWFLTSLVFWFYLRKNPPGVASVKAMPERKTRRENAA